ncbi:geranylgeranyl transferase type-1 subunit beta [Diatrype stigma]|uniref:Geranylgeranyl transferase type-1 subunit beta n=1 Tax=Diatrype stigma TaxID=117547 RepID=A0AAN9UJJ4_9PEZI
MTTTTPDPPLDTARHIRYWQRCLRTLLPHHYTANDSTRLTIGYFVLAALDLLSSPSSFSAEPPANPLAASLIPAQDRPGIRAWILSLQHPEGGFCGSPHHVLPAAYQTEWTAAATTTTKKNSNGTSDKTHAPPPPPPTHRDPENANIAATYFALLALGVLADDDGARAFARVDRLKTLRWLRRLQREDGSFGENVDRDGYVAGGRDMRPCYLAATIRWVLGGAEAGPEVDFDVGKLVTHIRRSQAFDGGIAESSMHESHAGYAYCAVAALSLLDQANPDPSASPTHYLEAGIPSIPALIHFLVSRQFAYQDTSSSGSSTPDPDAASSGGDGPPDLSSLSISPPNGDGITGFNGRLNKAADTCYVWWVGGTLCLLGQGGLVDRAPARRFLLEKTEHVIGGFAKHPGGPPDIYHAYLGLAALATMAGAEAGAGGKGGENAGGEEKKSSGKEEGLGQFDPRLCVGAEAAERIRRGREALLAPARPPTPEDSDGSSADEDE